LRLLEAKHGTITKKRKRDLQDENSQRQVPRKKKKVYDIPTDINYVNPTEDQERLLGKLSIWIPLKREANTKGGSPEPAGQEHEYFLDCTWIIFFLELC
jgi:hypothetical protein